MMGYLDKLVHKRGDEAGLRPILRRHVALLLGLLLRPLLQRPPLLIQPLLCVPLQLQQQRLLSLPIKKSLAYIS